jgi:hypothetical protein
MFDFVAAALLLALPYLAVLTVLTVLTPSWHWVAGFIVMSGSALIGFWIWHWIIAQRFWGKGYFVGLAFGLMLTLAFAIAVLTYAAFRICYQTRE